LQRKEVSIELDSNEVIKTLGLLWHPLSDQFLINKGTRVQNSPVSKHISSILACCTQNFPAAVVAAQA
jgi:hypothetical protein